MHQSVWKSTFQRKIAIFFLGRELGEYGLEAYTEVKTVTMSLPGKMS